MNLASLEAERGGDFTFIHEGEVHAALSPSDLSPQRVLAALASHEAFAVDVLAGRRMLTWQVKQLRTAWMAHHGLPDEVATRRLFFYVERYGDAIEVDLMAVPGCPPMAELWQGRQWRRLLNVIDHLPRSGHFAVTSNDDPEYAEAVANALAGQPETKHRVSGLGWDESVHHMALIADEIRMLRTLTQAVNSEKGRAPKFEATPRPTTLSMELAEKRRHERRLAEHNKLAGMMLGRPSAPM